VEKGSELKKLDTLEKLNDGLRLIRTRRRPLKLVLVIISVILLCTILSGLVIVNVRSLYQASSTISHVGTLKAIGIDVYWEETLASRVKAIDWGSLEPGAQKSFTVYIRNEGNVPVTLRISASNWSPPAASDYLTLTWRSNDETINAATTIPVTLTLSVSESITGISGFSFDINALVNG